MPRYFGDQQLGNIELFCLTARLGSFTAAAREAGVTPAAVSRSITKLEERLTLRLFNRTTRKIVLTEAGASYFAECEPALRKIIEVERNLLGEDEELAGTIRMSLPTPYGQFRVIPVLAEFHRLYPKVHLEIHLSNRNVDLLSEHFDLIVRARPIPDSGFQVRKLEDAELVVVASPDYLDRAGQPNELNDLEDHDCIQFILPSLGRAVPWMFRLEGQIVERDTKGSNACTEELMGGVACARAGMGLYQIYRFIVEQDLRRGHLQEVLSEFGGASRPFSLLYPRREHVPARVRTLIEFIRHRLGSKRRRGSDA